MWYVSVVESLTFAVAVPLRSEMDLVRELINDHRVGSMSDTSCRCPFGQTCRVLSGQLLGIGKSAGECVS